MDTCAVQPYLGNEKYIFASYSHRDAKLVFPILERLGKDGYRIWYDEGIEPGKRWGKIIAAKIEACEVFLSFVSKNYTTSENCQNELYFANERKRKQFIIYIDDEAVPAEIALMISSVQGIFKSKYSSDEAFFNKLLQAGELAPCTSNAAPGSAPDISKTDTPASKLSFIKRIWKKHSVLISIILILAVILLVDYIATPKWPTFENLTLFDEQTIDSRSDLSCLIEKCKKVCLDYDVECCVAIEDNYVSVLVLSDTYGIMLDTAAKLCIEIGGTLLNNQIRINDFPKGLKGYLHIYPDGTLGDCPAPPQ